MSDDSPIRVLIADEPAHARAGLRAVLEGADDVVVVGEAGSDEDTIRKAGELRPDIVFFDPHALRGEPLETTRAIHASSPDTQVILFAADTSRASSRASISDAIQAGVSGYLLKDASADELVNAARLALEGKAVIHPTFTRAFIEEVQRSGQRTEARPLSRREKEILRMTRDRATTNEISDELGISPHTVKTHLARIFEKIGANDRWNDGDDSA